MTGKWPALRPRVVAATFLLAMTMWACGPVAATEAGSGRLQYVRALIEESSAAKRVENSHSDDAKARRAKARELHREAVAADAAGDRERSERLLGQAAKTMFEAVRLADGDGGFEAKKEKDFDARLGSVNALMSAFERVCEEKKCPEQERSETRRGVETKVNEAKASRIRGDLDHARTTLDQAYVAVKVAIEHRRGGDTLVRSLQFKSKEEEYRYELDRNETHRMLITLLVGDKAKASALQMIQKAMDEAGALRLRAEKEAASGKFEAAVESLELSTRELQRALRGAGIYIPG
ncbi:MAG: hypothetical protein JNL33_15445 [Betaproteobacteria bacterium]|nr:hypothetical protein [Betaproteobacteria bacterium]